VVSFSGSNDMSLASRDHKGAQDANICRFQQLFTTIAPLRSRLAKDIQNPRRHFTYAVGAVAFAAICLNGCKPAHNMEKQPYYRPYTPSASFVDGMSERPLVPGVVPRPADQSPGVPYVAVRGARARGV